MLDSVPQPSNTGGLATCRLPIGVTAKSRSARLRPAARRRFEDTGAGLGLSPGTDERMCEGVTIGEDDLERALGNGMVELVAPALDGAVRNQATRQAGDSAHAPLDPSCSGWDLTIAIRL